jgi:hypothetical protein
MTRGVIISDQNATQILERPNRPVRLTISG